MCLTSRCLAINSSDFQASCHNIDDLLESEPSPFEVSISIAKLKEYKSPGIGFILADLLQAGCEILRSETHKGKKGKAIPVTGREGP
jgi:hypothetical protein